MNHGKQGAIPLLILLLSLCGAGIAVYLTAVHYEQVPLLCSASGVVDCQRVTSSIYSLVPGTAIPITIPGLIWALVSAVFALLEWRWLAQDRRMALAHWLWSLVALIGALYLVYVEIVRLHTLCLWCTAFHAVILAIFLLALARLTGSSEVNDTSGEYEYARRGER